MNKQKKFISIISLTLFTLVFPSCIGIKSEIWIHDDGRGEVQVEYRMPMVLIDGLKDSEYADSIMMQDGIAIPGRFTESGIREKIERLESLALTDYKVWQQGEDVFVFYKIEFSDAEELYDFDIIPEIYIEQDGDAYLFEQDVCSESGLDFTDEEVVRIYEDYKNTFIIHTPTPISAFNMGKLTPDKKTLVFTYNMLDAAGCGYINSEEQDDKLRVEW